MGTLLSFTALFFSIFLVQLGSGSLGPLDALSGAVIGFSTEEIGLLGSAHFFGFFLGCYVTPRLIGDIVDGAFMSGPIPLSGGGTLTSGFDGEAPTELTLGPLFATDGIAGDFTEPFSVAGPKSGIRNGCSTRSCWKGKRSTRRCKKSRPSRRSWRSWRPWRCDSRS